MLPPMVVHVQASRARRAQSHPQLDGANSAKGGPIETTMAGRWTIKAPISILKKRAKILRGRDRWRNFSALGTKGDGQADPGFRGRWDHAITSNGRPHRRSEIGRAGQRPASAPRCCRSRSRMGGRARHSEVTQSLTLPPVAFLQKSCPFQLPRRPLTEAEVGRGGMRSVAARGRPCFGRGGAAEFSLSVGHAQLAELLFFPPGIGFVFEKKHLVVLVRDRSAAASHPWTVPPKASGNGARRTAVTRLPQGVPIMSRASKFPPPARTCWPDKEVSPPKRTRLPSDVGCCLHAGAAAVARPHARAGPTAFIIGQPAPKVTFHTIRQWRAQFRPSVDIQALPFVP